MYYPVGTITLVRDSYCAWISVSSETQFFCP